MKTQANFVAIDCETANHQQSICQIGIVVVRNGDVVEKIERLIQPPNNEYDFMNSRLHGITSETTKDSPFFAEVWNDIKDYFNHEYIVAHNGKSSDWYYIKKELDRNNLEHPWNYILIDTMDIFGGYKLSELCAFYDMNFTSQHSALNDALACANLFLKRFDKNIVFPTEKTMKDCLKKIAIEKEKALEVAIKNADTSNFFYKKGVVFTGFIGSEKDSVKKQLLECGAIIKSSISRNVDIVIKGDEPGPSKMKKLKEFQDKGFDILVLEKEDFYKKIKE